MEYGVVRCDSQMERDGFNLPECGLRVVAVQAELAVQNVSATQPVLEATAVHVAEGATAPARRNQSAILAWTIWRASHSLDQWGRHVPQQC